MCLIYPQPMGHHVFIWRIDPHTQKGNVYIRHNIFSEAPRGAAIYSIIDPVDEKKLILDHHCYWETGSGRLARLGGKNYAPADFARYQVDCAQDPHSVFAEPIAWQAANGGGARRQANFNSCSC